MNFKDIIVWLGIFIIGSLIVTFLVSPNSFQSFKSNVVDVIQSSTFNIKSGSNNIEQDVLISNCQDSLNSCVSVSERKYGLSILVLEREKFNDKQQAEDFYNTWKGFGQSSLIYLVTNSYDETKLDDKMPLVLFALKVKWRGGQIPYVAACSEGELSSLSKAGLLC